jgi:hypothetical protein
MSSRKSTQSVFTAAAKVLTELLDARIFSEEFKAPKKVTDLLDDAAAVLEKIVNKLSSKKEPKKEVIDVDFNKAMSLVKKADDIQNEDQFLIIQDLLHFVWVCIPDSVELIKKMSLKKVEFASDSSSDDNTDDETDDESSDSESDDESDDDDEKGMPAKYVKQVATFIGRVTKAKLFKEKIDTVVKKCDNKKMSQVLSSIKKTLEKCVSEFKKGKDTDKGEELLDDALVDLEHCYKIVEDEHEEQMFLVKESLHDMLDLFELHDKFEQALKKASVKGIKMSRD